MNGNMLPNTVIFLIIMNLLSILFMVFREFLRRHGSDTKKNTESLSLEMMKVVALEIHVAELKKNTEMLPKMREDINAFHLKIRELKCELKRRENENS